MDYTTKISNNTNPSFKMTREEVVNSLAYNASKQAVMYSQEFSNDDILQGEVIEAYELGAEYGYQFAIDKACEWLYEYNRKQADKMFGTVHTADVTINVAQFRKAMKGE